MVASLAGINGAGIIIPLEIRVELPNILCIFKLILKLTHENHRPDWRYVLGKFRSVLSDHEPENQGNPGRHAFQPMPVAFSGL
jgi:hypothetical protein